MEKDKILEILKKWRKKIEKMESELSFCDKHNFNLEYQKINSEILILNGCKIDIENALGIDSDKEPF